MLHASAVVLSVIAALLAIGLLALIVRRRWPRWLVSIRDRIDRYLAAQAERSLQEVHDDWLPKDDDADKNDKTAKPRQPAARDE